MKCVIADTGPLVALLDRDDEDHAWAVRAALKLPPKMITCEAVLSEVHFLTQGIPDAVVQTDSWLATGALEVPFGLPGHREQVYSLMQRYADVPMSLADACLVRMSELWPSAQVFTLDSDFRIYRRNRRQSIPLICPLDS